MKALRFAANLAVVVGFGACVWALWFYDQAREAWRKWQLGDAYEGPLED